MSKEVAAAILTKLFFDKVPNSAGYLYRSSSGASAVLPKNADRIGKVYAHFLGHMGTFEVWAAAERRRIKR